MQLKTLVEVSLTKDILTTVTGYLGFDTIMIPANCGDFINIDQLFMFLLNEIVGTGIRYCLMNNNSASTGIQLASDIVTKSELLTEAKQKFESLLAECLMFS
jgi:hypothetical protein